MKIFRKKTGDSKTIPDMVQSNLEKVENFERRHHGNRSLLQKSIEQFSVFLGTTKFFVFFVAINLLWIAANFTLRVFGHQYFDAPPFAILQDIVTYIGVFITMAVLIRQNRLSQIEETRAQLELQVNLLSEQKISKVIDLLEELRRDMPDMKQRLDSHAADLQKITNPDALLNELENRKKSFDAPP